MGDGGSSTMETRCGQRQLDDEVKPAVSLRYVRI
jgi:hypothetical protein